MRGKSWMILEKKKLPSSVKLKDSMFKSKTYNNHTLSVAFNWQGFKLEIISTWSSSNISTILFELLPVELREDAILTNIEG